MTVNSTTFGSVLSANKFTNKLYRFQLVYRRRNFSRKLLQTYGRFTQAYPQWQDGLFDTHFLTHGAAPLWENYIVNGIMPTSSQLIAAWRSQIGSGQAAIRPEYIAELGTAVADFLAQLKASLPTH